VEGKDTRYLTFWRWLFLVAWVGGLAGSVSAQSLVDVAKKEKERRSKLEKQEPEEVPVITDRELQTAGRLPETLSASTTAASDSDTPSEASAPPVEEEEGTEETKTREYWQNRTDAAKKKIADLEAKLQDPDHNWGEGIRNDVNPIGQRNLSQRQEVERELEQAKAELRAVQDEARRAGVPPGWVR
jgi:hypothetical protein